MIKQINIKILALTVLLVSLFSVSKVLAQVYPVQVSTSTAGPFHNYLSYYADENNHLQAIVTLTDFNSNPVQARLRITFSGPGYEIKTNPNVIVGNPFTLSPGVPVILNGIDFLPYFQQSNILTSPSGIDISNLPEGFTTICIDIIRDGTNQEILSTNNCTSFFLQKFQPPIPTLPACSSSVDPSQMFYTFQWTPPVGYVPSIGADLTYTFSLYEWNDPNNYNIFQTGQGLVYTTQTTNSLVQLSNYDVVLQEGKDYVWRVEAVITKLGQQINMITNNGLSTPCSFTYGQAQTLEEALSDGLVINLNAEGKGEHKGRAYWTVTDNTPGQGLSTFNSYLVEYRKKPTGNENYTITWFKDTVQTLQHFIYQLEASTTYEVKVSGIVGTFVSPPSNTAEFTTFDTRIYACGEQDMPYLLPNYQPLALAEPDMIFNIGQFSMKITEITPTGTAGHFSGKGLIPIQFLAGAKAKVSFDDILVDDQFNVRDGQVNVVTRGLDNWLHQQYMQFIDPIYVNGSVDSIYVANGSAWVIVDGDTLNFVFDPVDYPIIINDENGYQYTINPDGTVIVNTYIAFSDDYLEVGPDEMVTFAQNDNEVFGFDPKEHMAWHENYEAIEVVGNGDTATYFVSNKSLGVDATDYVDVVFPNNTTGYTYKIDNGSTSPINGNTIQIPSFPSKGEHELYVQNANGDRVGKLNLIVYEEKEKDLVIVPIANVTLSENDIKGIIDQTFLEANVNVSITIAPQWNDSIFTPNKTIALPGDVGLLNKYSNEMRAIRDLYFDDTSNVIDEGAYYIFVVPGFDNPATDGYMVRGKSLGFVKAGAPLLTYAHELAHGIGGLNHSWKENGPSEASTENLMDYNGGINLIKSQWKEIRDLDIMPSLWDDQEAGQSAGGPVKYYKVKITYSGGQEKIISRTYIGSYQWIKNGLKGSETSTKGTYTTGVNKYYKEINGKWEPFRFEHFGKVFYMRELTDNEGVHQGYTTYTMNSNTLQKTIGGDSETANGIYQVTTRYIAGENTPYARYVQNYELTSVIDHYSYGGTYKKSIYFNDPVLSEQFKQKVEKFNNGQISYKYLVRWLESHPRKHTDNVWNAAAKNNAYSHLNSYSNDYDNGPVYSQYQSSWTAPYMPAFAYQHASNQTYNKGIIAHIIVDNGNTWTREAIVIEPSANTQASDDNHIHAYYGSSNCTHSLTEETQKCQHLITLMNNTNVSTNDIAEYIAAEEYCFLYGLDLQSRKDLFSRFCLDDGSWSEGGENIINQIWLTTKDAEEVQMLQYFKTSGSLNVIIGQLSEWLDFSDQSDLQAIFRLFRTISKDLLDHKSSFPQSGEYKTFSYSANSYNDPVQNFLNPPKVYTLQYPYVEFPIVLGATSTVDLQLGKIDFGGNLNSTLTSYGLNSGISIKTFSGHPQYNIQLNPNGKISVTQNMGMYEYYDGIYFTTAGNYNNDQELYKLNTTYDLDPYDFITIVIGDNYGQARYDQKDVIQVPAIMGLLISQAMQNQDFNENFRVVTDVAEIAAGVAAVALAIPSGGASVGTYVAIVGSIKSAVDLGVFATQSGSNTQDYNSKFYQNWDAISGMIDVVSGGFDLPNLVQGCIKLGGKTFRGAKSMTYALALRRSVNTTDLVDDIASVSSNLNARTISTSIREGISFNDAYQLITNTGTQLANTLENAWLPGWNKDAVLFIPKGDRPPVTDYLKQTYINAHTSKFTQEGAGFIIVKSWTESGDEAFTTLPSRKFVGLRSEMDNIINQYKTQGNDWTILRDELNLGENTNLANEEIYYITIDGNDSRFTFEIPNGNESGAIIGEWEPGGYTKNGTTEAALVGSENITHNKNINQLLSNFTGTWEKIR